MTHRRHGEYIECYSNGQPQVQEFYRNGKLEGESKSWYDTGQLWSHSFYHKGLQQLNRILQKFYLSF